MPAPHWNQRWRRAGPPARKRQTAARISTCPFFALFAYFLSILAAAPKIKKQVPSHLARRVLTPALAICPVSEDTIRYEKN
jgi:hypothetical protein